MSGPVHNNQNVVQQIQNNVTHGIDFGCRIVTRFSGLDGGSKFVVAVLTVFKQYVSDYTDPYLELGEACGNAKNILSGLIDFHKFTASVPIVDSWIKPDATGRDTFLKKMNLTCASLVTAFDVYNFILIVGSNDKISNHLKLAKNLFFIGTCTTAILKNKIALLEDTQKCSATARHIEKWKGKSQITSNDQLKHFYERKIAEYQKYVANPQPGTHQVTRSNWEKKIENWQGKIQDVNQDRLTFAIYNDKIAKKTDIWESKKKHFDNKIELTERDIKCLKLKTTSLVIDVSKISLKVLAINSLGVLGVAVPIYGIAEAAFNFINVYLGYTNMKKFHFNEYEVKAHVSQSQQKLGVDISSDKRMQFYSDTDNFAEVNVQSSLASSL